MKWFLQLFFFLLFSLFGSIYSQNLTFPMDFSGQSKEQEAEKKEEAAKEEQKKNIINEIRSKMLRKTIDDFSDREVDEYLKELGAPTTGSIYDKRQRLSQIFLSIDKKVKDDLSFQNPPKKEDDLKVVIENATEGEFIRIDKTKSGVMVLRGKVRIKLGTGVVKADSVTVDSSKKEIYAEGNIYYEDGFITASGDKLIYDTELKRGVIYNTRANAGTSYFIGQKIKKVDETKFALDMGYFTACNAEVPHYSFNAKRVIIDKEQTIIASNLNLTIGGMDVLWLPLFYTSNIESGWVVQAGRNNSQGTFLQTSYAWSEPLSVFSLLSPMGRKVKMDYYEKTGQAAGLELWKRTPQLNYQLELGYANFQQYQATSAYETRFKTLGGVFSNVNTNQVDRGDLCLKMGHKCLITYQELLYGKNDTTNRIKDIGEKVEPWRKINLNANSKTNLAEKDQTRNVQFQIEDYNNPRYEYEFGYRFQPSNTIQSLYTRRQQRNGMIKQVTSWNFDYTESRGDLTVSVQANRLNNYFILKPYSYSGFYPLVENVPKINIQNSTEIAKLPYFESPVYWDLTVSTNTIRYYAAPTRVNFKYPLPPDFTSYENPYGKYKSNIQRTDTFTSGETGFKTSMNFNGLFSYQPAVYVGANKRSFERADNSVAMSSSDLALDRQVKRDSFTYLRNNHIFTFGSPILLLTTTYRRLQAIKPQVRDTTLERSSDRFSPSGSFDKVHEVEVGLSSNSLEFVDLSVSSIRDLRRYDQSYQPQPQGADRWFFTVFRMSGYYDFLDGFSKNKVSMLEQKRSFYSGIFMNNDFVYHTPKKKPLYNQASVGFKTGGFKMPLIRRINRLEFGGSWFHVYNSALLDNYRVYLQLDILLDKYNGIEVDLDSRVTQSWRYTGEVSNSGLYRNIQDPVSVNNAYLLSTNPIYQPTSFEQDLIAGTGGQGTDKKKATALNMQRLLLIYKANLHNFDFKIGYSMDLRSIPGGLSMDNQLNFYDQAIFVVFSFTNFGLGTGSQASEARTRLYRFRKRPLDKDAYRSSYSATGN